MDPLPADLVALLPVLRFGSAFALPLVAGFFAVGGARALGLDAVPLPGLPGFRWSTAAGLLAAGWGLCGALGVTILGGAADVLADGAALLARLGGAGACLFVGAWAGRAREALAEDSARERAREGRGREDRDAGRDARIALAVGALTALLTLTGAGNAVLLVGGALVALGLAILRGGALSDPLRDALRDLAAGIDLRARLAAGATVEIDGRTVTLIGRAGLLGTRTADGGELRNRHVLAALPDRDAAPALPVSDAASGS